MSGTKVDPSYPTQDPKYSNQGPDYIPQPVIASNTQPPPVIMGGYQQNQQNQQPVIIQQPIVMKTVVPYGRHPQATTCPSCRASVITRVEIKPGLGTWLICGGICLLGFWLGCQFIPFCIDDCKDAKHYCPNCNAFLGERKML